MDELTGEALAGAEFTITRISGLPSHNGEGDGEVVAVITTDAHGIAVTPLLPYGRYKVEETKVPPYFVDNDFSTEMVINEENFCTYEIDVENEPTKGWLRLTKTDRENGNPIASVVFDSRQRLTRIILPTRRRRSCWASIRRHWTCWSARQNITGSRTLSMRMGGSRSSSLAFTPLRS